MEAVLELDSVAIVRGGTEILKSASARFFEGTTTIFIGPSGSGKSTLLKAAAGLMPPEKGETFYKGVEIFSMDEKQNREYRRNNGFVFQDGALWANSSVYDNLALPLKYHFPEMSHDEIHRRIDDAIRRIGFRDSPYLRPAQLSGGERKMIGFMRALITDPQLVFCDAPIEHVDAAVAARIRGMIRDLKKAGTTLLVSSHDRELISSVADYLLIIDSGTILTHAPYREVLTGEDEQIREILSSVIDADSVLGNDLLALLNPEEENPFA